ncbi:hypothetical protein R3P38DRAFT_3477059, partial [Favolaschia claudopus]
KPINLCQVQKSIINNDQAIPSKFGFSDKICRSWRIVAHTTPRLWASMHIVVPPTRKLPQLVDLVSKWIQRSGAVPLDFSLVYPRKADYTLDISSLITPLVAESHRWREVQLEKQSWHHLTSLKPEDVPVLASVTLPDRLDGSPHEPDPPEPLLFLGTRSLRSLRCSCTSYLTRNPISWASLTSLNAMTPSISYDFALDILSRCPLLETCTLHITGPGAHHSDSELMYSTHRPSLFHLHHLFVESFGGISIHDPAHLFDKLDIPALGSFERYSIGEFPPNISSRAIFPSVLTHIERLKIGVRTMSSELLISALAAMPILKELHIIYEPYEYSGAHGRRTRDRKFLARLSVTSSESHFPTLCPRLRYLTLGQFKRLSDNTLLNFILSRTEQHLGSLAQAPQFSNVVPLRRVSCTLTREMERDILPELEPHRGDMQIELKYEVKNTTARWTIASECFAYSPLEGMDYFEP